MPVMTFLTDADFIGKFIKERAYQKIYRMKPNVLIKGIFTENLGGDDSWRSCSTPVKNLLGGAQLHGYYILR